MLARVILPVCGDGLRACAAISSLSLTCLGRQGHQVLISRCAIGCRSRGEVRRGCGGRPERELHLSCQQAGR